MATYTTNYNLKNRLTVISSIQRHINIGAASTSRR